MLGQEHQRQAGVAVPPPAVPASIHIDPTIDIRVNLSALNLSGQRQPQQQRSRPTPDIEDCPTPTLPTTTNVVTTTVPPTVTAGANLDPHHFGYVVGTKLSFIDVPGQIATVIFLRGCSIRCADCHNCALQQRGPEHLPTHSDTLVEKLNAHRLPEWLCFQGGEPLDQSEFVEQLIKDVDGRFRISIYTGYSSRVVFRKHGSGLLANDNVRMLKCGKFMRERRVHGKFLATTNQQVFVKNAEGQWDEIDWVNVENVETLGRRFD
ncbi:hypothetical protein HK102_002644 [Quaeritorhiza haematococci]|nr:hypothetical protein HK102_002644 [Quaeritorhiza haematococci]